MKESKKGRGTHFLKAQKEGQVRTAKGCMQARFAHRLESVDIVRTAEESEHAWDTHPLESTEGAISQGSKSKQGTRTL